MSRDDLRSEGFTELDIEICLQLIIISDRNFIFVDLVVIIQVVSKSLVHTGFNALEMFNNDHVLTILQSLIIDLM